MTPVTRRPTTVQVEHTVHEPMSQLGVIEILEHVHADALLWNEADDGAHAVDASGVHPHRLAAIILDEPTKSVAEEVGLGEPQRGIFVDGRANLRRNQFAEGLGFQESLRPDATAVENEAHPLRHVRYARPDRAR